jgi:hypothetical protein
MGIDLSMSRVFQRVSAVGVFTAICLPAVDALEHIRIGSGLRGLDIGISASDEKKYEK